MIITFGIDVWETIVFSKVSELKFADILTVKSIISFESFSSPELQVRNKRQNNSLYKFFIPTIYNIC
jgi:hypothetical protein